MVSVFRNFPRLESSDLIAKSISDVGYLVADDFFQADSTGSATIGRTTIGSTIATNITGDTAIGCRFTASDSGTLTKIWAYVNIDTSGTAPMRVAIYSNGGGNTIGSLIASSPSFVNVTNTSPQWIGVDINASITSGQQYWLFVWLDTSGFSSDYTLYYDDLGVTNNAVIAFGNSSFGDWSQVGDGTNENYTTAYVSIYGDITTAGGGSYSLTCTNASFSVSGQAVTLRANRTLTLAQRSFTLSGQALNFVYSKSLAMAQGSFTLSGQALNFKRAEILPMSQATFSLSGQAVNLKRALNFVLNGASYTLTRQSANLNKSLLLSLNKADFSLSGQAITLRKSSSLTIGESVFSLSGQAANLKKNSKITANQQSYTLTGQPMTFVYTQLGAYTLVCHEGAFTLSGQIVGLNYTPANQYTLTCTKQNYNLSGQASGIYKRTHIDMNQVVYSCDGQTANLFKLSRLNNSNGSFTLTGQDLTLTANKFKRRYFITS